MAANSTYQETARQVIAITNSTSLTMSGAFGTNYTANTFYIITPPTAAWLSQSAQTALSGTVTTSTTNNFVSGNGTNFVGQLQPGNILGINNDEQVVVSIINSTALTVGDAWTYASVANTPYLVSSAGLSYLNSSNALYTTFKQFQIKIVLQSNNSARVPLLDDLRVLALQL